MLKGNSKFLSTKSIDYQENIVLLKGMAQETMQTMIDQALIRLSSLSNAADKAIGGLLFH
jgi:hypothetical protein